MCLAERTQFVETLRDGIAGDQAKERAPAEGPCRSDPDDVFHTFDENEGLILLAFHTSRDPQAALERLPSH